MSQSEWIKIDPAEFNQPRTAMVGGVDTMVALSPHDVPTAFRSSLDAERKLLLIQFRYIDDEPTVDVEQPNGVTVQLGNHSKRLMGLSIPTGMMLNSAGIRIRLSDAGGQAASVVIQSFEKDREAQPWARRMRDSYETVRKVLEEKLVAPGMAT